MNTRYTPGPWTVIQCGNSFEISQDEWGEKGADEIVHLGKIVVGTAATSQSLEPGITNRADADLIAAAPCLLEALQHLVGDFQLANLGPAMASGIYRANAAIFKATGACSHGVSDGACKACYMDSTEVSADERFLTQRAVEQMVGFKRVTLWRWAKDGRFPKPIKYGNGANRYLLSEVKKWMQDFIKQSKNKGE